MADKFPIETIISSQIMYKGNKINLRKDDTSVQLPDENIMLHREIVESANGVVIVPLTSNERIIFVRQSRWPIQNILLELPAGGIEFNENEDAAALRELREETGYRSDQMLKLGGFFVAPGYSTEYMYGYLARDLTFDPLKPDFDEFFEIVELSWSEVIECIKQGIIQDAKTLAVLFIAKQNSQNK